MVNIKVRVRNLIEKYGTRDPETLANELGIVIKRFPFRDRTKGFFMKEFGKPYIVINSNLPTDIQKLVIAHEVGHARLHSNNLAMNTHKYTLFPHERVETEANKFAAELLINENDIDKHYLKEMTISQLACYYGVPVQLIELKFHKKQ